MGICGWSNPNSTKPYVIFASHLPHEEVIRGLENRGIAYKECLGSYKGEEEDSYLIPASEAYRMGWAMRGQETVLWLTPMQGKYRKAYLFGVCDYGSIYPAGHFESLGKFYETTEQFAKNKRDAWTKDLSTGIYYITAKP